MVPDPSLTRRQFLGSLGGAAAGGTVLVGATVPTALPDALTDQATRLYPTPPEIRSQWWPTITEAHATEAVDSLDEVVHTGRDLWQQLDTDERFTGAGGHLESARDDLDSGDYFDALFSAHSGIGFAAEQLGIARARLGTADLERLRAETAQARERADAVADDISAYRTAEPARDLAWYYHVERQLAFARFGLDWDAEGETADHSPREIGELTANLHQGRIRVRSAERFRDLLFEKLDGSGTDAAGRIRDVVAALEGDVTSYPSRDTVIAEYVEEPEDSEVGPYEFAHERLARWCFDLDYRFTRDRNPELLVYGAAELARALVARRAHERAVDALLVEPGDDGFDSGHVLAEKRRARSAYQSVVGSDPPPLLTKVARRAIEDLQVAEVGFGGSYQRPVWRERLKAYLYALVGRAKLRETPPVYDRFVGEA